MSLHRLACTAATATLTIRCEATQRLAGWQVRDWPYRITGSPKHKAGWRLAYWLNITQHYIPAVTGAKFAVRTITDSLWRSTLSINVNDKRNPPTSSSQWQYRCKRRCVYRNSHTCILEQLRNLVYPLLTCGSVESWSHQLTSDMQTLHNPCETRTDGSSTLCCWFTCSITFTLFVKRILKTWCYSRYYRKPPRLTM